MGSHYSAEEQKKARFWWLAFSAINTFAFQFLAGNIVLLFIIGLGASNTLVGFVSSFIYISYLIMPIGRKLSQKVGLVRGFVTAWLLRYFTIIPLLIAPLLLLFVPDTSGRTALWLVVGGYMMFQLVRGMGMVSYSPVMTEVSHGADRGRFLSLSRIITDFVILLGSLLVVVFLGDDAPTIRYFLSFSIGFVLGIVGVYSLSRIPEVSRPEGHVDQGLLQSLKEIFSDEIFLRYFVALIFAGFTTGILRPFILVYVKDIYGLPDNQVLLLTVVGSVGSICMGIISRRLLDRLGAKPMLMHWLILMLLTSLAIVFMNQLSGWLVWLFLALMFFSMSMGVSGADNTSQTYFFGMIRPEQQMSYGIIFFIVTGISGGLGSNAAGILLDILQGPAGFSALQSQKLLFGVISLLLLLALVFAGRMKRLGAMTLKGSLSEIFTMRQRRRSQG